MPVEIIEPATNPATGLRTWTCTVCKQQFDSGDWNGCRGNLARAHRVAPKTYRSASDGLVVCCTKPETFVDSTTGKSITTTGKQAMFVAGLYTTEDPSLQEVLDTRGYWQTPQEYEKSRTSPELYAARTETRYHEEQRLRTEAEEKLARLEKELAAAVAAQKPAPIQQTPPPFPAVTQPQAEPEKRGPGRPPGPATILRRSLETPAVEIPPAKAGA